MLKKIAPAMLIASLGFVLGCGGQLVTDATSAESFFGLDALFPKTYPSSISSVAPAPNSTGISITPQIRVFFSEDMNPGTITNANIIVTDENNNVIPGAVAYSVPLRTANVAVGALNNSTRYIVTLTTGITAATGIPLSYQFTFSFTTVDANTVPAPEFSLMEGSYAYSSFPNLSIVCSDPLATIRYTTDGSVPTQTYGTVYGAAISISSNTTVRAIAYRAGLNDSSITSTNYSILVDAPAFSLAGTTYSLDQDIDLSCATPGAVIHYTTDGSIPTASSPVYTVGSPIPVHGNGTTLTINAIGILAGLTNSSVMSNTYTIDYDQVSTPTIDVPAGNYTVDPLDLHITTGTAGATVYYTLSTGGSGSGTPGSSFVDISLLESMTMPVTVTAWAEATMMENSAVVTATYTIDATAPTCSVTAPLDNSEHVSIVPPNPAITISCDETMNISTFTSNSTHTHPCTGNSIQVSADGFIVCAGLIRDTAVNSNTVSFHPSFRLDPLTLYQIRVTNSVTDLAGNAIGAIILTNGFKTDMEGTLDTGFAGTGYTVYSDAGAQQGNSVQLQSDNRIVVAGMTTNPSLNFAVWRFNADGTFDLNFNTPSFTGGSDASYGVAITPSRIIAAGYTMSTSSDFGLAGYQYSGSLDISFGGTSTGYRSLDFLTLVGSDIAYGVAVDALGRIVVAGSAQDLPFYTTTNFATARFYADGMGPDTSFGPTGMLSYDFGTNANEQAKDVVIDPGALPSNTFDDRIIVAGWYTAGGFNQMALLVYDDAGGLMFSRNTNFGFMWAEANAVAVQSDRKILLAGFVDTTKRIVVARYNFDGSIDTGFGVGGRTIIDVTGSSQHQATAIAVQPNGKILIAGNAVMIPYSSVFLARLNADGSLDPAFARSAIDGNDDGIAVFNTGTDVYAKDMVIQPDGRVVITGYENGTDDNVIVLRYK